ncbi:MAG: hypothetical protein BroJett021_31970 [Chloroflexota bacterium]|nr:MAG: hypothetical protein BroJett021_31970 [Chloroflexota bacterium]
MYARAGWTARRRITRLGECPKKDADPFATVQADIFIDWHDFLFSPSRFLTYTTRMKKLRRLYADAHRPLKPVDRTMKKHFDLPAWRPL